MTATTPHGVPHRIGQFVMRRGRHGYRTGQWAQILTKGQSGDRDCWLVIYHDGETDVIPVDPAEAYVFRSSPTDWQSWAETHPTTTPRPSIREPPAQQRTSIRHGLRRGDEHRTQIDKGVDLIVGLEDISEADERGMHTVMCIINGRLRPVLVRDNAVAADVPHAEKADKNNADHVAAPFAGVVTVGVADGDQVSAGQTIATTEAMKMEAAITTTKASLGLENS
jgi:acetyl/propionyl-CoA carboxylase alpha subunit